MSRDCRCKKKIALFPSGVFFYTKGSAMYVSCVGASRIRYSSQSKPPRMLTKTRRINCLICLSQVLLKV